MDNICKTYADTRNAKNNILIEAELMLCAVACKSPSLLKLRHTHDSMRELLFPTITLWSYGATRSIPDMTESHHWTPL